jgi:hypothetical protein
VWFVVYLLHIPNQRQGQRKLTSPRPPTEQIRRITDKDGSFFFLARDAVVAKDRNNSITVSTDVVRITGDRLPPRA